MAYGKVLALQGVSLEVQEGELVGVIGPNGAGKSTLLRAIAGGLPVSGGAIRLDGDSIIGIRPERVARRGIALVPEGRHIFGGLTVAENLQIGATVRLDRDAIEEDLDGLFQLFPALTKYYRSPAGKLSGGEQQQLAIARALIGKPRLLMLDEPSLGLAPVVIERVFETFELLRASGVTILLVEQLATRAVELADRAYVLRTGRIALEGSRESLLKSDVLQEAFFGFAQQ